MSTTLDQVITKLQAMKDEHGGDVLVATLDTWYAQEQTKIMGFTRDCFNPVCQTVKEHKADEIDYLYTGESRVVNGYHEFIEHNDDDVVLVLR